MSPSSLFSQPHIVGQENVVDLGWAVHLVPGRPCNEIHEARCLCGEVQTTWEPEGWPGARSGASAEGVIQSSGLQATEVTEPDTSY